ncbi:MAG: J domain-containing protein [Spirochaetales bacterium]|nr:J domain-containing protein [Spirochaetales bacterium]
MDIKSSLKLFLLDSLPSYDILKRRYYELIKEYHPDKHPDRIEWSTQIVKQLNEAYVVLKRNIKSWIPGTKDIDEDNTESGELTFERIVTLGDNAIRDAVLMGWLKRIPKDSHAVNQRSKIEFALNTLMGLPSEEDEAREKERSFFTELFSSFLRATEYSVPKPFSVINNSTMFFHYLSSANTHLDDGVRNFYRFLESNNMNYLFNIPVSFLEDAIRLYRHLYAQMEDPIIRSMIECRMNLSSLYARRISDPELSVTWQYI